MNLTLIKDPFVRPRCQPLLGGKWLWLREDIIYIDKFGNEDCLSAGFIFDGYSAFIFRRKFNRTWNIAYSALHDYQYASGEDKQLSDRSLVANMEAGGDIKLMKPVVYGAVSTLGWVPYIRYAYLRKQDPDYMQTRFAVTRYSADRFVERQR